MDAVLPLTLQDYERSLILRRSLSAFFTGLGTVFVVTPDHHYSLIHDRVSQYPDDGLSFQVLPETDVVPELDHFPKMKGWRRQQLIKLAVFEHVRSDFYLTLDADVIATRRVSPDRLVPGGRAICLVNNSDEHPNWYVYASALLGEPGPRNGITHNVTPAILARDGVADLATFLEGRWKAWRFAKGWRGRRQQLARFCFGRMPRGLAAWRLYLCAGFPWTEYALYYSFLEARQRFSHYHVELNPGISDQQHSYWFAKANGWNDWPHQHLFEGVGPPFFAVIQSNTGVTAGEVRNKISDCLPFDEPF